MRSENAASSASCSADTGRKSPLVTMAPIGWLLLAVGIVHHPVLWIDHVLWDEISFEKMAASGDLSGKLSSLADQGVGAAYLFYVVLAHFSEPTHTLRIFSFLSLWILAAVIYGVLRCRARLSVAQSLFAAFVMVTYPAFQMYANAGTAIYVIHLAIFGLAVGCYFLGSTGSEHRRWWLVLAAGLWTISFTFQPLLVYFYAFFAALALSRPFVDWKHKWQDVSQRASLARIHALLMAMPLLHYFIQKAMFPLHPYFASWYSRPTFALGRNLKNGALALDSSLVEPFDKLFTLSLTSWSLVTVAGLSLMLLMRVIARNDSSETTPISSSRLALIGCLLLAGGLFPFVVTGKPPSPDGPETRYSILVAPSLAIVAAGGIASLSRIRQKRLLQALEFFGCTLLAVFALLHARIYMDWQAAAIKDHAIIAALRSTSPPAQVNFFIVTGVNLEHRYARRHYDWGYLLSQAWGGFDRVAEMRDRRGPVNFHYYTPLGISREKLANFRQWMGYGNPGPPDEWCQLDFKTTPALDFGTTPWGIIMTDVRHRLGLANQSREAWLKELIPVVSISAPQPFLLSSAALPRQTFRWDRSANWKQLNEDSFPSGAPIQLILAPQANTVGTFSILPLGPEGFALRCDDFPSDNVPAVLEIRMLIPASLHTNTPERHMFGVACDYFAFNRAPPPRVVLVTLPYKETEGLPRQPDVDSLEAWSESTPAHAWLLWKPRAAGDMIQIRSLKAGFTCVLDDLMRTR